MIKHTISYQGKNLTLREAAKQSGIPYDTLRLRYERGWRGQMLFQPVNTTSTKHRVLHDNQYQTLRELAAKHNLPYDTVRNRYLRGWRGSALVQPRRDATKHYLTFRGETKSLREWTEETGVAYATALSRIRSGMTDPDHILNPEKHMRYDTNGLPMPHHVDENYPMHLHAHKLSDTQPQPSEN